jgi:hypothetical protein
MRLDDNRASPSKQISIDTFENPLPLARMIDFIIAILPVKKKTIKIR